MKRKIQTEQRLDQSSLGQKVDLKSACLIFFFYKWDKSDMMHIFRTKPNDYSSFSGVVSVSKNKNCQSDLTDGSQSPVSPDLAESQQCCLRMIKGATTRSDWDAAWGQQGRDFGYLHTSHRRYFGGHSSSQLARLHMHTRWGSPWGAPGINMPCYNAMGPHKQMGCRENGSGQTTQTSLSTFSSENETKGHKTNDSW